MPRSGPPTSGYERIAQEADLSDSDDDESSSLVAHHVPRIVSIQPHSSSMHPSSQPRYHANMSRARRPSNSAVDIKVINARLERWADQIANKFKFKKDRSQHPPLEILHSVFAPPDGFRSSTDAGHSDFPEIIEDTQLTSEQFDGVVESVRIAISKGVDPKLIKQGSSGSYFMRDSDGKIVAVFKPKDEEPFPCFFGRSCLIPNLSYISEAAACLLDRQFKTYMVPYTDIVHISSKAFHYDYWDRRAFYRRHKPLPSKVGSFQIFLQGYQDANIFLRENPWPDPLNTSLRADASSRGHSRWNYACRPSGDSTDDEAANELAAPSPSMERGRKFIWTDQLKQNFREELEKLVILDYIMRNTDRGLDNWMIKVDYDTQEVCVTSRPVSMNLELAPPLIPTSRSASTEPNRTASPGYRAQEPMVATSRSESPSQGDASINIGAIDNSLAFPWKHPDQWRSFPFGWLFLPVSLIGQPFSQKTRDHFIPLLTSTKWWSETQTLLRRLFEQDADFKERMFQKQLAVLKGQAFNVVETLKMADQGPLELTRRPRVHVWDDEMEVPIAVPLRIPSSEERRRRESELERNLEQEEMDIGALVSSAPVTRGHNLIGFSPPRSRIPSAVRLGLTPARSSARGDAEDDSDRDSQSLPGNETLSGSRSIKSESGAVPRPNQPSRVSYDARMVSTNEGFGRPWDVGHKRRNSRAFGFPTGYYHDDTEGDLGYSAVTGSEGASRRVIAERLEAVKSRNPVFTWC